MADPIGAIYVELSASTAKFMSDLDKAQRKLQDFSKDGKSWGESVEKMGMLATGVGTSVAAAFIGMTKMAANTGEEFLAMSKKTGASVEDLSALSYVAGQNETSIEAMQKSMGKLARAMDGAQEGGKTAKKTFESLGIQVTDADGKLRPIKDLLLDVSDVFAKMPDGPEKTAAAIQLFGKAGMEMIPFLNNGRDAIEQQIKSAKDLGLVWTRESAVAADNFNDNIASITGGLQGISDQIAIAFLPMMAEMVKSVQPVIETGVEWAKWFQGLDDGVKKTVVIFVAAFAAGGPLILAIGAAVALIATISAPILIGGLIIVGIIAGVAAIIANWDTIKAKAKEIWTAVVTYITDAWQKLKDRVASFWGGMRDTILAYVKQIYEGIKQGMVDKLDQMLAPIKAILDKTKAIFQGFADALVLKSIIPDMIQAIGDEFASLDAVMAAPITKASAKAIAAFDNLSWVVANAVPGTDTYVEGIEALNKITLTPLIAQFINLGEVLRRSDPGTDTWVDTTEALEGLVQKLAAAKLPAGEFAERIQWMATELKSASETMREEATQSLTDMAQDMSIAAERAREGVVIPMRKMHEEVSGGSIVPDMVEDIRDNMEHLDAVMVAPARKAATATTRAFLGMQVTTGEMVREIGTTFGYAWGSATQSISTALARSTTEQQNWAEVGIGIGQQFMASMINLAFQLMTQQVALAVMGDAARTASSVTANASILATHTATAGGTVSIWTAAGTALTGLWATVTGAFASMNATLILIMTAVGEAVMGVLTAIAEALIDTIFGSPWGIAILAGVVAIGAALATLAAVDVFAKGGIVTGPTLGMMGEGGSSEAVIPLNDHGAKFIAGAMGSYSPMEKATSITIHNYTHLNGREVAYELVDYTIDALRLRGATVS